MRFWLYHPKEKARRRIDTYKEYKTVDEGSLVIHELHWAEEK